MSLIQEALKRQHEELAGGEKKAPDSESSAPSLKLKGAKTEPGGVVVAGAPEHAAAPPPLHVPPPEPGTPAALPPAPVDVAGKPGSKKMILVAGLAALVVVLVIAVFGGISLMKKKEPTPPASGSAPQQSPAVPRQVRAPSTPQPAANTNLGDTNPLARPPPEPPTGIKTPAVVEKPPAPKPPPPPAPVIWPILTVKGLIYNRGGTGAVSINGAVVAVGEEIEGVKVLAVSSSTVTLGYKGQTSTLRPGDTTK